MQRPSFSGDQTFYALNALAAGCILACVAMLVWRVTAWIGLVLVAFSLAGLAGYCFYRRFQMHLLEFLLTMMLFGNVLGLTFTLVWPLVRGAWYDWVILLVWLVEAGWVLGGALWAMWAVQMLRMEDSRARVGVLLTAWAAPAALAGFAVGLFLSVLGVPIWVLTTFGLKKIDQPYRDFDWWVLFGPPLALASWWVLKRTAFIRAGAARAQAEAEEMAAEQAAAQTDIARLAERFAAGRQAEAADEERGGESHGGYRRPEADCGGA